jgi:hypothetical protein
MPLLNQEQGRLIALAKVLIDILFGELINHLRGQRSLKASTHAFHAS